MPKPINILLADDDEDDRFLFETVLKGISFTTKLDTVDNGEKLMKHLKNLKQLPDVLFLDLNMPRKNGSECLMEIKADEKLKGLPVIIYSTSLHQDVADLLYQGGAYYYVRKTDILELKKTLLFIIDLFINKNLKRPTKNEFILSIPQPKKFI